MRLNVRVNRESIERLRGRAEALKVTQRDMGGPVLTVLGQVHRKQMLAVFASQGRTSGFGRWAPLEESYRKRKVKTFGRKPILQLTGNTKNRFTIFGNPGYIQRHLGGGRFYFGAASDIAAAHALGNPSLAPHQFIEARRIFGGIAPRLPVRDMIHKTAAHLREIRTAFAKWYVERVKQVIRHSPTLGGAR